MFKHKAEKNLIGLNEMIKIIQLLIIVFTFLLLISTSFYVKLSEELDKHQIALVYLIGGLVPVLILIHIKNYLKTRDVFKSAWIMRTSNAAPECELINVEIRKEDGSRKILWKVKPSDVDFTDEAKEPVICFLICKEK
ncbi:hypothetical protein GNP80_08965 [Aliivibrio fischeri]|uniref:hypothetical protein n=1 Tax=Aliivibrio fischeri TaxID=668 RepID=UPI0012D8F589|nr:hypothetical protein [Aliivibrio fischeri]MUK92572.1 hypothetical protein [Aliivibrio fischeri]